MTIRNSRLAMHHLRTKIAAPAFVAALAFGASVAQAEVIVTTGSGYIPMVKALVAAYQTETGAKVGTAFGGNIGQMLAQTASGSGVNVVVSDRASLAKFKMLDKQEVVLGTTPIVLIWRKGLTLSAPEDLAKAEIERIAYPDPKAAVYGRATEDFLKTSGLGAKLEGKTNIVSAVPQVTAYVAKGEMDAGFVNRLAAKAQHQHAVARNLQCRLARGLRCGDGLVSRALRLHVARFHSSRSAPPSIRGALKTSQEGLCRCQDLQNDIRFGRGGVSSRSPRSRLFPSARQQSVRRVYAWHWSGKIQPYDAKRRFAPQFVGS